MDFTLSTGFADTYKAHIQSTLESLVKQLHSIVQAYCTEEEQQSGARPRFYLLSKRLALTDKVNTHNSYCPMGLTSNL